MLCVNTWYMQGKYCWRQEEEEEEEEGRGEGLTGNTSRIAILVLVVRCKPVRIVVVRRFPAHSGQQLQTQVCGIPQCGQE